MKKHTGFLVRISGKIVLVIAELTNVYIEKFKIYDDSIFDSTFLSFLKGGWVSHVDFWFQHKNKQVNVYSADSNRETLRISFFDSKIDTSPSETMRLFELDKSFSNVSDFEFYINIFLKNRDSLNLPLKEVLFYNEEELLTLIKSESQEMKKEIPQEVIPYIGIDSPEKMNIAVAFFLNAFADRITQKNTNEYAKKKNPFQTFEEYKALVYARTGEKVSIIDAPINLNSKQAVSLKQMVEEIKNNVPQNAWSIWDKQMDVIVYEFFRMIFMLNENQKLIDGKERV